MGLSMPLDGNVQYGIKVANGISIHVDSLDDLMDGSPEELLHFGHVPTEGERRLWIEQQGGTAADKRKLVDIARKKAEHDPAEAPITA